MRSISTKRAKLNRARKLVEQLLFDETPWCARCGRTVEVHGHELVGRGVGGDFTKPDVMLCNFCNTWCEDNKDEAIRVGWKKPSSALRHPFDPDQIGFYCLTCNLPLMNQRHR